MTPSLSRMLLLLVSFFPWSLAPALAQDESYPDHPDSVEQPGVPKGKIEGPFPWKSNIYPGTVRNYWLYVPQQYQGDKPACAMVVQDGLGMAQGWKLPVVMDNLIHAGQMPITIGIFIDHGQVPPPKDQAQPRFNRSFEYDSLGDRYARFLIEEILPEVNKRVKISDDPNDRAIAGASSGAICAFNAAWERPDHFRRVLSTIGTYVGLRGADIFPTLIRKCEPKPLRVFLQDGDHDLNIYAGDWWMANQSMLSALRYSGYDVHHIWGNGGHNAKHAAAILPDAMRWLWRDYPKPITASEGPKARMQLMIPGEGWQLVSQGHQFTEGPATGPEGSTFFVDVPRNQIFRVDDEGKVTEFAKDTGGVSGLMMGPDGKLYGCQGGRKRIVRYTMEGKEELVAEDASCNDLVVLPHGLYYTDPGNKKLWYVPLPEGPKREVDSGLDFPNGLIASADQTLLHVADSRSNFTYCYQIQSDGSLAHRQTYGYLHKDDAKLSGWADGMAMDTEGRLYVASEYGLQVLDQLGRTNFIFSKPQPGPLANVVLSGKERNILFITCGDKVFRRKINATGTAPWEAPVKAPKPGL